MRTKTYPRSRIVYPRREARSGNPLLGRGLRSLLLPADPHTGRVRSDDKREDQKEREINPARSARLESDDLPQHQHRYPEIARTEEHPPDADERIRRQPADNAVKWLAPLRYPLRPDLVNGKPDSMQQSPRNECPRRPVPQPAEQHGEHEVDVCAAGTFPVSSERYVQVVAQPL